MKTKHFSMKSVISMLLAVILVAGTLPVSVFAAQKSDYEDPADNWLKTNNRTNELDMNATVTYETQFKLNYACRIRNDPKMIYSSLSFFG